MYSAHQKSGDRDTETVQFYVVITYTKNEQNTIINLCKYVYID